MSIHAFHSMGLYSRRLSHSRSFAVLRLLFVHSGRLVMLWSLMAFWLFSMALSKLPEPKETLFLLPTV